MRGRRRPQQQRRGIDRSACDDETLGAHGDRPTPVHDPRSGDFASGIVGVEPRHLRVGEQSHVLRCRGQRWPHGCDVGVALGIDHAGKRVAGFTQNASPAWTSVERLRRIEGMQALLLDALDQTSHRTLVRHPREGVVTGTPRVSRVFTLVAVNPEHVFGLTVERFEVGIVDGPRG
jgi:hypothetical protein